jgi:hypothetical protein
MKVRYILLAVFSAMILSGCDDFLSTDNLTKKDNSNFPKTEADAEQSLTGCYAMLRNMTDDDEGQNIFIVSEILSDERFGGGGPDDRYVHALDRLKKSDDNMFSDIWKINYQGIYRCNMLLESLDNISFDDAASRNKIEGEARFLRAYFYFNLCKTFGKVPLIVTSQSGNEPQAEPDKLYAQIATDLQKAITLLPATNIADIPTSNLGHATHWAAEGMLARVFLFFTGYYEKESLPTNDATISKDEVVKDLKDCIDNSGHKLMPDYRDLWPYSNKYTKANYPYSADNDLNWYGEEGANVETMFAIKYSSKAIWDNSNAHRNNQVDLYFSPREADGSVENNFPLGVGWGFGTVNPNMLNDWKAAEPNDLRIKASIFDTDDEAPNYAWGADKQYDETGLWQKKYCAINVKAVDAATGDTIIENYSRILYPNIDTDYQLNNIQDIVVLRFADVLLMYSELTKTVDGINEVRQRAGLDAISSYTDTALRNERRWELAFEGLRWYDLLRWHIAGEALEKQNGVAVQNNLEETTMDMQDIKQRVADTGGFLQIPQTQIDLSDGVLKQNNGWTGDGLLY